MLPDGMAECKTAAASLRAAFAAEAVPGARRGVAVVDSDRDGSSPGPARRPLVSIADPARAGQYRLMDTPAGAMHAAIDMRAATKADLTAAIAELKADMLKVAIGIVVANTGLTVALVKLL